MLDFLDGLSNHGLGLDLVLHLSVECLVLLLLHHLVT